MGFSRQEYWSGVPLPSPINNLDSIFKSRDITLSTKVCLVKAMVFPVVMYGCERWTIKKAEHRKIDAFELWCWRKLLRVPWTARRSNQSILKEISSEYSLEDLTLKLKLQYFGHLIQRTESLMPPNHLILYCPLLLLPSVFPSIRLFSNESALRIRWPK